MIRKHFIKFYTSFSLRYYVLTKENPEASADVLQNRLLKNFTKFTGKNFTKFTGKHLC